MNSLTVLTILQFLNLIYIKFTQPTMGVATADILWVIYFQSNFIIFVILMCADVIYSKVIQLSEKDSVVKF